MSTNVKARLSRYVVEVERMLFCNISIFLEIFPDVSIQWQAQCSVKSVKRHRHDSELELPAAVVTPPAVSCAPALVNNRYVCVCDSEDM